MDIMLLKYFKSLTSPFYSRTISFREISTQVNTKQSQKIKIGNTEHIPDNWTNVSPRIISHVGRNLHRQKGHPLNLVLRRIINYFYTRFPGGRAPEFSVHLDLHPVVTVAQNFDSLLVPKDHPSRARSDCYYINENNLLRAHTTAHLSDCVRSGLNSYLTAGDIYRRDEIDCTHYPVFHQVDGARLRTLDQLYPSSSNLSLFSSNRITDQDECQACHTAEVVKLLEEDLKSTLMGLAHELFGSNAECRWTPSIFPFTHPSWELEVRYKNDWLELLGCGIIRQEILNAAGATDRVGWAFGIGLERLAMHTYQIPDIRLFWSKDTGFLSQWSHDDPYKKVVYKPVSVYPQCVNDMSFWLPEGLFVHNDFYELVRNLGGDYIEQVALIDEFKHPKNGKMSHCYRITYRHMHRTLTQREVNQLHEKIGLEAQRNLGVTLRL